ncbi:MAG: FHA domain-containing protein [Lautropia sp.]|nr:FHA domain-containing protein [Lautropia sp.]
MSAERLDSGDKRLGQLTLVAAHCPLRTYWLTETRTTIGRRASNMLVLDDLTVSGEHALLVVTETEALIQDLDSSNGTLLNGMPVARALLNDGDCIDIGVYRLVFYRNPPDTDAGTPPGHARHPGPARHRVDPDQLPPLMWLAPAALPDGLPPAGGLPARQTPAASPRARDYAPFVPPSLGDADGGRPVGQDLPGPGEDTGFPRASGLHRPGEGTHPAGDGAAADPAAGFRAAGTDRPAPPSGAGFTEGFSWAPRLPPRPLPPARPLSPRERPPLHQPEDFLGVSLRFLGGHDAGRLLLIDRPIVSIRNGSGHVAVVTRRAGGFFLTHVEGHSYPLVNGESIGLGAHPLRNHDLIELSGTIIQFCQGEPSP